ncbi:MAG: yocK 2 [Gemmataceae bacterium]|nr:yocK 2 [Gemmataceae bacterium]
MTKATLTTQELREYRGRLMSLVARLDAGLSELRNEALRPVGAEAAGGPPDASVHDADRGSRAADEELALGLLGPAEVILAEANAALKRIEGGTFGRCEDCGKPITRTRLDALPYARRCIRCARGTEAAGAL